jgi:hypothetical protein
VRRFSFALGATGWSSTAFASDPSGLFPLLVGTALYAVCVFALPAFFVPRGPGKVRAYLILLVMAFGIISVASVPFAALGLLVSQFSNDLDSYLVMAQFIIPLPLAGWLLRRFGGRVLQGLLGARAAQQGTH